MKELRDIKLDLLMGNQNPIVDLFKEITNDLKIINTNVYNEEGLEFIYYQPSTNEWIFFQDAKNGKFWCNFATYWSLFESKLGLEYLEIQSITKYLLEEALKREVTTTPRSFFPTNIRVEEALKREVTTISISKSSVPIQVEEALKRELTKPLFSVPCDSLEVEEALKKEIAAPDKMTAMVNGLVERSIKIKNK